MDAIRLAGAEDTPGIVDLGRRAHAEGAYAFLPYDPERVREHVARGLGRPDRRAIVVATAGDAVRGVLAGHLEEYLFCAETVAVDTFFYVDAPFRDGVAARGLIEAFRGWARARGARELCLGISSGINTERTARFYEKLGLTRHGMIYKVRL